MPVRISTITSSEILMNRVKPIQVRRCRSSSGSIAVILCLAVWESAWPIYSSTASRGKRLGRVQCGEIGRGPAGDRNPVARDLQSPLGIEPQRQRVVPVLGVEGVGGQPL